MNATSHDNPAHRAAADRTPQEEPKPDIDQLQAELAETRQHLGETVDALSSRLDVKGRAKARVDATRQRTLNQLASAKDQVANRVTDDDGNLDTKMAVGAGVAVLVFVLGVLVVRRHRNA